ncbi:MAG: DUF3341 domain-containing protein [Bryobacteraceae bacterium]
MRTEAEIETGLESIGVYGVMAEFPDADELVVAARRAYEEGYRKMDAYSSFPVHGLAEAIGFHRTWMPQIVLAGGLFGCIGGYGLCYYMTVIAYPLNVGGRPLYSWPSYIPITFECTVLAAAFAAVIGMLALNGLPMPYHPVFNVPRFLAASQEGFFLCIETSDPMFDPDRTKRFLESLHPLEVTDVAN